MFLRFLQLQILSDYESNGSLICFVFILPEFFDLQF
jgi:hypothetical protein